MPITAIMPTTAPILVNGNDESAVFLLYTVKFYNFLKNIQKKIEFICDIW